MNDMHAKAVAAVTPSELSRFLVAANPPLSRFLRSEVANWTTMAREAGFDDPDFYTEDGEEYDFRATIAGAIDSLMQAPEGIFFKDNEEAAYAYKDLLNVVWLLDGDLSTDLRDLL